MYVSQGVKKDVLRIANGPYYNRPGSYRLYVRSADAKSLEAREVRLGVANMDYVEIESGLNPGETLVINDMSDYSNNNTIKLKQK